MPKVGKLLLLGQLFLGRRIRICVSTRAKALIGSLILIEWPATSHGIAEPVIKSTDARSCHIGLCRLSKESIIRYFTKVPSLAVEIDLRTIHAVLLKRQTIQSLANGQHVLHRVMPHEIKPESVHAILFSPSDDVLATRRGFDVALGVEALVVARNDAVKHRLIGLS